MHSVNGSGFFWLKKPLTCGVFLFLFFAICRPYQSDAFNPEVSATGSLFVPGLGQFLNGAYVSGSLQYAVYQGLATKSNKYTNMPDFIPIDQREVKSTKERRINKTTLNRDVASTLAFDMQLFSSYDAYRVARNRPEHADAYRTPAPSENLFDLLLAPYRPRNIFRWTSIIPIFLAASAALGTPQKEEYVVRREGGLTRQRLRNGQYLQFTGVGLGEEAFFRGYLNTAFSDAWGETWGLIASSAIFGLAHNGEQGSFGVVGASLAGLYLGALHQQNHYTLGQVVAIHTWWDILVSYRATKDRGKANVYVPLFQGYLHF